MGTKNSFFSCKVSAKGLATSFALATAGFVTLNQAADYTIPGRSLTDGEVAMFQEIYGDSIDYDRVKIHHSKQFDWVLGVLGVEGVAKQNVIILKGHVYSDDLSQSRAAAKHIYIHEMAHVWQVQNCQSSFVKSFTEQFFIKVGVKQAEDIYDYSLQDGKDLTEYGIEQQAEILANFHELKVGEKVYGLNEESKTMDKFEDTLQNFLKDPSYPRKDCWHPF